MTKTTGGTLKKLALGLSLLCLSAGLLPPASADPGAAASHAQLAFADWIELKGNTGTFIGAFGGRFLDEEAGVVTLGGILRGKCNVRRGRNITSISCFGFGRIKELPLENFQMHPSMETASLDMRAWGFDNHVDWTGKGRSPIATGGAATGGDWVVAASEVYRDAKTSGNVLGDKVASNGWLDWGEMYAVVEAGGGLGAEALENTDVEGLDINVTPGGKITFTRTYRIPN